MMDDSWTEGRLFCGPGCGKLYSDMDGCSGCEVSGVVGLLAAIYAWRQSSPQRQFELDVLVTERDVFMEMAKVSEAEVEAIRDNIIHDLLTK